MELTAVNMELGIDIALFGGKVPYPVVKRVHETKAKVYMYCTYGTNRVYTVLYQLFYFVTRPDSCFWEFHPSSTTIPFLSLIPTYLVGVLGYWLLVLVELDFQ